MSHGRDKQVIVFFVCAGGSGWRYIKIIIHPTISDQISG